jgi:hypothetical protein
LNRLSKGSDSPVTNGLRTPTSLAALLLFPISFRPPRSLSILDSMYSIHAVMSSLTQECLILCPRPELWTFDC